MYKVVGSKGFIYKLLFALIMLLALILALLFLVQGRFDHIAAAALGEQTVAQARPTLIIDAGHGGEDGGAVSGSGTMESDINLDIAKRLNLLAGFLGYDCVMTRESETISYPETADSTRARKVYDQKARLELINSVENGILLSIHQNKFPDARPSGSQVFYNAEPGGDIFAGIAHENLKTALCPESRRMTAPASDNIYLMRNVRCPAILVECGFLSNPSEEALLKTGEYRLKIAAVLMASYVQFQMAE